MNHDRQLFLRIMEAGSIKAAAAQVGKDPSTLSRRLARLEKNLGVTLLKRSTAGSQPTEAGQRYYDGLRLLEERRAALEADVAGTVATPTGTLRLTAPLDFGTRFVVPILGRLQARFPDLHVEMILGSKALDIREENIDIAVRIGSPKDSSLMLKRLGMVPRVLVASPAYLDRYGTPSTALDLEEHQFILYHPAPRGFPLEVASPRGRGQKVTLSGHLTVNSMGGIRTLVEEGHGIHLGPIWAFAEAIQAGRLSIVLPHHGLRAYPLGALYAPSSYIAGKVRACLDALSEGFTGEASLKMPPEVPGAPGFGIPGAII